LGLTEEQPENNSHRILIEMLAVVLSKNARARAVQLPAWNEALGLPRPWDQQWSMRMQQIMAFETDLLEFDDLFDGSKVVEEKVATLKTQALEEMARIEDLGGVLKAVEIGYMKQQLVEANARRMARIESGEQVVVGVNRFEGGEPSPLLQSSDTFLTPDAHAEKAEVKSIRAWREARDGAKVMAALDELERTARAGENIMVASIAAAEVGVTTGEWGQTLRNVFGEYRAPTGLAAASAPPEQLDQARVEVENLTKRLGTRPRLLVAKPGLDGHSNGAEQVALMARDAGFEVIYEGIRQTAEEIASAAVEEGVHAVGLSVLSGSHMVLVSEVMKQMKDRGAGDVPIVVGGIIPQRDRDALLAKGIARIFTPKDYRLDQVLSEVAKIIG
ncbi:MAG: cobalamin-dependent protein, partial [Rhodospirillaceae bacterium]|nr:cobalamin-dependent protein [Rhodospirillaceae bacterium]